MSRQLVRSVILAAAAVLGTAKTAKAGPLKPSWSTTVRAEASTDVISTSEIALLTSTETPAPATIKTLTTTITTPTAPIETKGVAPEGTICGEKGYLSDSNSDYVGSGRNGSVPECLEDCLQKDGCHFVVFEEDVSRAFYSEVVALTYQNTPFKWYELSCL